MPTDEQIFSAAHSIAEEAAEWLNERPFGVGFEMDREHIAQILSQRTGRRYHEWRISVRDAAVALADEGHRPRGFRLEHRASEYFQSSDI